MYWNPCSKNFVLIVVCKKDWKIGDLYSSFVCSSQIPCIWEVTFVVLIHKKGIRSVRSGSWSCEIEGSREC